MVNFLESNCLRGYVCETLVSGGFVPIPDTNTDALQTICITT